MKPHLQILLLGMTTLPLMLPALDWNAGRDFKANEYPDSPRELLNPNGTVTNWSYGTRLSATGLVMNLYTTNNHYNTLSGTTNLQGYWTGSGGSSCGVNVGPSNIIQNFGVGNIFPLYPGEMDMHPSQVGSNVVVRWVAPSSAEYSLLAYWRDLDNHGGDGGVGWIVTNGVSLFSQSWTNGGAAGFTNTVTLAAGAVVDFVLGRGGDWWYDTTAFNALITNLSDVTLTIRPAGPGQATIAWAPTKPGYVLQETDTLSPPHWIASRTGATNPVIVTATSATRFFRLVNADSGGIGVLLADPPELLNLVEFPVRICARGLSALNPAADVTLIAADLTETRLSFTSGASPNELNAVVPSGLPVGAATLRVTALNGERGLLPDGLQITASLNIALQTCAPDHVSPSRSTALAVRCQSPPTAGFSTFVAGARAWLRPSGSGPAVMLDSPLVQDASTFLAVVPAGLSPGACDLLVVNPDGAAGALPSAVTVLTNEPPSIAAVTPVFVTAQPGQIIQISGQGFASGAQAVLICRSPLGAITQIPCMLSSIDSTRLDGQLDASSLAPGSIGAVKATNPDGGSTTGGAINVESASFSSNPWSPTSNLRQGRRSPALAYLNRPGGGGYLFAIGGDSGTASASIASVESASVDAFEQLGSWSDQRNSLPAGRCFAGVATVGQCIYLVGGQVGGGPASTVLRATLLDSLPTPVTPDFTVAVDTNAVPGIASGLVQYQVSAVYPSSFALNPGGEGLAGGIRTLPVPAVSNLVVTLSWPAVPDASGYRVYKAAAGGAFALLGEVSGAATQITDFGQAVAADSQPLSPGSLGLWHAVPALTTARAGHAVVAAPSPDTPGQFIIYAIGGSDATGTVLGSLESLRVGSNGNTGLAWAAMPGVSISPARAEVGAWLVQAQDSPSVPAGQVALYVGPGATATGFSSAVQFSQVMAGGGLQAFTAVTSANALSGYAPYTEKNRLLIAGGTGGSFSVRGATINLDLNLSAWNAMASPLTQGRVYPGFAQSRNSLFIAGGADGGGLPLNSVERATR